MSLKHQLKPLFRKLGLMMFITQLKYLKTYLSYYREGKAFLATHPQLPFPPSYMLYIAYGLNYKHYLEDGERTARWIKGQFAAHLPEKGTVLDWGCGPARITRHLPQVFENWQVIGTDYDQATIDWCSEALPNIQFLKNELTPPLPIGSAAVQAAISISIFTHLSAAAHENWKLELARVLAPGGLLFVTTQGDVFLQQMSSAEQHTYQQNQLVVRATGPEGHRIFGAYHPPKFMQAFWGTHFDILQHQAGTISNGKPIQDNWILKRK
jgi:SAM-dependent methyltransferase